RERREHRVQDGDVVALPLDEQAQGVQFAAKGARPRVEGLDPRPVGPPLHGVLGALLGAVARPRVGDLAAPVLHAVDAARHELDEVEIPSTLPREHSVGEAVRGMVDLRHVTPERHRRTVDRLSPERRHHSFAFRHFAPSLSHAPQPPGRPGPRLFGTFRSMYGLTVHEARTDDADLLRRLRAGETPAFEEMVQAYQHRVFGVALRMLRNAAEAEEVAQETFLRAHRALPEFRGDAKLSTWLYAITSRLCLTRLGASEHSMIRQGEDSVMRLAHDTEGPDAILEQTELEGALHRAIAE